LRQMCISLRSYLVKNQGKVVSKEQLFESVWEDKFTQDGTLNVHIRKLREAIERDPNHPEYIITIWKDGYIFKGEKL
ncbi:MAG: helix-turn-helix domain-containing protein, partial [Anaeroplasmataceae bacterium]|nr:helix-turn-helix domain-containing protein [Anaeroplasmataceae bacterium]